MNQNERLRKTGRRSNVELLRIVLMFLIVFGHMQSQINIECLIDISPFNRSLNIYLGSCARIAVDCFIVIGSWFLVDAEDDNRIFRKSILLLLKAAFVEMSVEAVYVVFGAATIGSVFNAFFQLTLDEVWFVPKYAAFLFLIPFINKLLRTLKCRETLVLLGG